MPVAVQQAEIDWRLGFRDRLVHAPAKSALPHLAAFAFVMYGSSLVKRFRHRGQVDLRGVITSFLPNSGLLYCERNSVRLRSCLRRLPEIEELFLALFATLYHQRETQPIFLRERRDRG